MATPGDTASLNTIAAALAGLTATVNAVQGQITETRQDVRDVKTSLGTLVPQAVYDVTMRDLAGRVTASENRMSQYVTVDIFAARVKAVDSDFAEIRETLKAIPDTKRQNLGLWISAAAAAAAGIGACSGLSALAYAILTHHP
ncbi:MAG TPA: hypothetical protein VGR57_09390 [Ktedonobacterales bacterium]|nr:hypothetical protein [Ktedonobacterales bacterium]